jgi:multidrug resistance efflux pump
MAASSPGEIINAGATVLQLQDTHLEQQLLTLQNRIETLKVKIKAIQIKRTQYENSTETLLLLSQIRESLQNEREQIQQQKASLNITAKATGRLIPDPAIYKNQFLSKRQENLKQHLSGVSLLEEAYHAAFIPEGTRIGMIAKPDSYEVLLAVEEHWARNVAIGTDVLVFSKESPENRLTGILKGISVTMHEARFADKELLPDQQLLHRYLSQQPGRSKKKYFYAVVSIAEEQPAPTMSYYQLCRVRLRTENSSLWNRFSDFLSRTLVRL